MFYNLFCYYYLYILQTIKLCFIYTTMNLCVYMYKIQVKLLRFILAFTY